MLPLPARLRAASAAIAAVVLAAVFAAPAPASAGFGSPGDFNRAQVALRANAWVRYGVPYDQSRYYNGYRQDCSGFVSMAWGLGKSHVTWTLPEVAWPIHKSDLKLGDIMLDITGNGNQQHVVIFDKWANAQQTAYWEWELAGSTNRPVHRVVPYPFWTGDRDQYKPYRFARAPRYTGKKPPSSAPVKAAAAKPAPVSVAPKPAPPAPAAKKPAPRPAATHTSPARTPRPKAPAARPRTAPAPAPAPAAALPRPVAVTPRMDARAASADAAASERALGEPVGIWLLRSVVAWLAA